MWERKREVKDYKRFLKKREAKTEEGNRQEI